VTRPTNTQFAVASHVLLLLVDAGGRPVSSEEMARSVQASPVYLRRVLGRLRAAALVSSRPGPHGGWQLTRAPAAITFGDVWRAVHGDEPVLGLHGPAEACPVGAEVGALMNGIQDRITRAIEAELDRTTLIAAAARAGPAPAPLEDPVLAHQR
jgi:Rrf2 family protein